MADLRGPGVHHRWSHSVRWLRAGSSHRGGSSLPVDAFIGCAESDAVERPDLRFPIGAHAILGPERCEPERKEAFAAFGKCHISPTFPIIHGTLDPQSRRG